MKSAKEHLEESGSTFTVEHSRDRFTQAVTVEQALDAMEAHAKEYALACLQKASENARMKAHNFGPDTRLPEYQDDLIELSWGYKEVTIDKASINTPENLV